MDLVLHGQGGIGKTSLAVNYAWAHLADYPGGLFLLDCSANNFQAAIADIAPYVFIGPESDSSDKPAAASLVKTYLETLGKPVLLILDNIQNAEHWNRLYASGLLPLSPCHIIVTSRDPDVPTSQPWRLERLSPHDGVNLLANYRDDIRSEDDRLRGQQYR